MDGLASRCDTITPCWQIGVWQNQAAHGLVSESCLLLITDVSRLLLGKHATNQLLCLRYAIYRTPTGKVGIEPTASRLTADRSTAELHANVRP